jgi:hypothetical protein
MTIRRFRIVKDGVDLSEAEEIRTIDLLIASEKVTGYAGGTRE